MFISNNLTGDISSPDLCDQHQAELGAASNTDSYAPASHPLSHKFVETWHCNKLFLIKSMNETTANSYLEPVPKL